MQKFILLHESETIAIPSEKPNTIVASHVGLGSMLSV